MDESNVRDPEPLERSVCGGGRGDGGGAEAAGRGEAGSAASGAGRDRERPAADPAGREEYVRYANESLLRDLVPVLDNLDRALEAARATGEAAGRRRGRRADPARAPARCWSAPASPATPRSASRSIRPATRRSPAWSAWTPSPAPSSARRCPGTCCTAGCCAPRSSPSPPRPTRTPSPVPRDYYEVLGVAPRRQRSRDQEGLSSARDAVSTPTATAVTRRPRSGSRKSTRPTRCCPIPTSAPTTTASARRGRGVGPGFGDTGFGTLFEDIFENFFSGGGGRGPGLAGRARRGSPVRAEDHPRGRRRRASRRRSRSRASSVRGVCRQRASSPGVALETCETVPRSRRGAAAATASSPWPGRAPSARARASSTARPAGSAAARGASARERLLSVKIPAGIEDGMQLRLTGEGSSGLERRARRATSTCSCRVREHELFAPQRRRPSTASCPCPSPSWRSGHEARGAGSRRRRPG